ncbi:MAG: hypothetical protein ACK5L5_01920 [Bacteroidales bacterium]
MKKYTFLSIALICTCLTVTHAQSEKVEADSKIKWGAEASLRGSRMSMNFYIENSVNSFNFMRESPLTIGVFMEMNKIEALINTNGFGITALASYNFHKKFWLGLLGSSESYYYDAYIGDMGYGGDMNISRVQAGLGYHNLLGRRLKFKAGLWGGILNGGNDEGFYVGRRYGSAWEYPIGYVDYPDNKKVKRIDKFCLNASFSYSANIYLELLPNSEKNRRSPITPFVEMTIFGSVPNATMDRRIDEWIDGNVVFKESIDYSDWDRESLNVWFGAGIKWYFKY